MNGVVEIDLDGEVWRATFPSGERISSAKLEAVETIAHRIAEHTGVTVRNRWAEEYSRGFIYQALTGRIRFGRL